MVDYSKLNRNKKWQDNVQPYLLLAPALIIIFIFVAYPFISGIGYAFQNTTMRSRAAEFIGFSNFIEIFEDRIFWISIKQSFYWIILTVVGEVGLALMIAFLLTRRFPGRHLIRSLFLIPWTTPLVAIAVIFIWLYNPMTGIINYYLKQIGLPTSLFLANIKQVLLWLSVPAIWRFFPFAMLMLIAAIEGIDRALFDSAQVDGANTWQQFIHITLPNIRPVLLITTLLYTIWSFNGIDVIWSTTRGGPANRSHILATYIYDEGVYQQNIGVGAAAGLIGMLLLLIPSILYFRLTKIDND
jgi:ABC-type sugar transport system permease subunit